LPAGLALAAALMATSACGDDNKGVATADVSGIDDSVTSADVAGDTTAPADTTTPLGAGVEALLDGAPYRLVFGASGPITVEVPEGTVSISIAVVGQPGVRYLLDSWSDSAGKVLVTPDWLSGSGSQGGMCTGCANRIVPSDAAFSALAPNNPGATFAAGPHTFAITGFVQKPVVTAGSAVCGDGICHVFDQFQCQADCAASGAVGPIEVTVFAKRTVDGLLPDTGVLDLNLHFTGAQGLTATTAKTDTTFQASIAEMRTLYAQVGITLGEIAYRDIDTRYQVIETFDGPDSDLIEMFEESAGNDVALNLFFVDELSAASLGGFGVILGLAGGIPGPPIVQGSPRSGVAIAVKPVPGAPATYSTTMAHEAGHFLGLFHTTEQNQFGGPALNDPIPDTPENDARYLMYNTGSGSLISVQQGVVMRSNPFIRHPAN